MRTARPSIGILTLKEMIAYPAIDEAARMARGLCFDSPMNVEARLILADIIKKQGHQGDNLLHGLAKNGHVDDLLETAEDGLVLLSKAVDEALGRPSRLTRELTAELSRQLEASREAERIAQRDLKDSRNELSESAGELWKTREALKAAEAQIADLSPIAEDLAQTQAELARVQAELAVSQQTLASVLTSASWKMTGPLRRLVSALKRR
jgi:chromosome segregation ATPase